MGTFLQTMNNPSVNSFFLIWHEWNWRLSAKYLLVFRFFSLCTIWKSPLYLYLGGWIQISNFSQTYIFCFKKLLLKSCTFTFTNFFTLHFFKQTYDQSTHWQICLLPNRHDAKKQLKVYTAFCEKQYSLSFYDRNARLLRMCI